MKNHSSARLLLLAAGFAMATSCVAPRTPPHPPKPPRPPMPPRPAAMVNPAVPPAQYVYNIS